MNKPQKNQITKIFRSSSRTKLAYSKSDSSIATQKISPGSGKEAPTLVLNVQALKKLQKHHIPPSFSKAEDITFSPIHPLPDHSKHLNDASLSIIQIKPKPYSSSKSIKSRNLSGELLSNSVNTLISQLIQIEQSEGASLSAPKVKKYLAFLDDIGECFPEMQRLLPKVKTLFEQLFFEYLKQEKDLKAYKPSKKDFDSFDFLENLSTNEKLETSFSSQLIEENKYLNERISLLSKDLKSSKSKEKQYQRFILHLKSKDENFEKNLKDFMHKAKPTSKVPRLHIKNPNSQPQGFHDEFMSHVAEFSESWRNLIPGQPKAN